MTPFNLDSPFYLKDLSSLEAASGIQVMSTLSNYNQQIQIILGLVMNLELMSVLEYWERKTGHLPPTWKNLLLIIRLLDLDELAQRLETYLSGETEEPQDYPEVEVESVTEEEESKRQ